MSVSGEIYQLGIYSDFIQEAIDWMPTGSPKISQRVIILVIWKIVW